MRSVRSSHAGLSPAETHCSGLEFGLLAEFLLVGIEPSLATLVAERAAPPRCSRATRHVARVRQLNGAHRPRLGGARRLHFQAWLRRAFTTALPSYRRCSGPGDR